MYEIVSSLCGIQTGTDLLVVVALDNVIIKLTDLLLFFFRVFSWACVFLCFACRFWSSKNENNNEFRLFVIEDALLNLQHGNHGSVGFAMAVAFFTAEHWINFAPATGRDGL